MTGEDYREIQRLNQEPLGQACQKLLQQAGTELDLSSLMTLQLGLWGLEERRDEMAIPTESLKENLHQQLGAMMLKWPAKSAQSWLNPDPSLLENVTPEQGASILVETLFNNLQEQEVRGYSLAQD